MLLGAVAAEHQAGAADPDLVTRVQGPLAADALAVDEGAVAGADVAHAPAGWKALEHGVQTRHAAVAGEGHRAVGVTADCQPLVLERYQLSPLGLPHLQVRGHPRHLAVLVAVAQAYRTVRSACGSWHPVVWVQGMGGVGGSDQGRRVDVSSIPRARSTYINICRTITQVQQGRISTFNVGKSPSVRVCAGLFDAAHH
jgi:hypothetical protein